MGALWHPGWGAREFCCASGAVGITRRVQSSFSSWIHSSRIPESWGGSEGWVLFLPGSGSRCLGIPRHQSRQAQPGVLTLGRSRYPGEKKDSQHQGLIWTQILPKRDFPSGIPNFQQDFSSGRVCTAAPTGFPASRFSPSFSGSNKWNSLGGWIDTTPLDQHPPAHPLPRLNPLPDPRESRSLFPAGTPLIPLELREGGGGSIGSPLNPTAGIGSETSPGKRGKNSSVSAAAGAAGALSRAGASARYK